jgi:hypothetical protein
MWVSARSACCWRRPAWPMTTTPASVVCIGPQERSPLGSSWRLPRALADEPGVIALAERAQPNGSSRLEEDGIDARPSRPLPPGRGRSRQRRPLPRPTAQVDLPARSSACWVDLRSAFGKGGPS